MGWWLSKPRACGARPGSKIWPVSGVFSFLGGSHAKAKIIPIANYHAKFEGGPQTTYFQAHLMH